MLDNEHSTLVYNTEWNNQSTNNIHKTFTAINWWKAFVQEVQL